MSLTYLLDTNVLAEPLRPQPNAGVLAGLRSHAHEIGTASVVWHEMWYGCRRLPPSARRQAIEDFLLQVVGASIPILPYDQRAADWHAVQRARLAAAGKTPRFADGMIAAVAFVNDLTLVTRNVRDFQFFEGVRLETWFS